jgi:hypothetical protein
VSATIPRIRTSYTPTLVRIGVGGGVEARVEGNAFTRQSSTTGGVASVGWAPVSIGMKYQLPQSVGKPWLSIGVIGRAFPTSGSGDFRSSAVTGDVRLAADFDLGPSVSINPYIGFSRHETDGGKTRHAILGAVTITIALLSNLNAFVDTGYQSSADASRRAAVLVDGGIAYAVRDNVQLDVSVGRGVHGPVPGLFWSVGLSLLWDR